jgi:hypothetical protein
VCDAKLKLPVWSSTEPTESAADARAWLRLRLEGETAAAADAAARAGDCGVAARDDTDRRRGVIGGVEMDERGITEGPSRLLNRAAE